jgi:hypothetical protein
MSKRKLIQFVELPLEAPSKKTKLWVVQSLKGEHAGCDLGKVKFYPQWRKYCFCPDEGTLFDGVCLARISLFCSDETFKWRAALKGAQS